MRSKFHKYTLSPINQADASSLRSHSTEFPYTVGNYQLQQQSRYLWQQQWIVVKIPASINTRSNSDVILSTSYRRHFGGILHCSNVTSQTYVCLLLCISQNIGTRSVGFMHLNSLFDHAVYTSNMVARFYVQFHDVTAPHVYKTYRHLQGHCRDVPFYRQVGPISWTTSE